MAYITQTDLETRWGAARVREIADRDRVGTADATLITDAIQAAQDEIDPYLSALYTLPLASTPGIIKRVAEVLAWAFLFREADPTHPVMALRDGAIATLDKIAKGTIALPVGSTPATPSGGFSYASTDAVFDASGVLDT